MTLLLIWGVCALCFTAAAIALTVYMLQYQKLVPSVRWRITLLWSVAIGCFGWSLYLITTEYL